MDGGGWSATVHEVTESDMTEQLYFHFYGEFKVLWLSRSHDKIHSLSEFWGN